MENRDQENSPPADGWRIGVIGSPNWLDVAAHLFRRGGLAADVVRIRSRGHKVRWVLQRGWRSFRIMHHLGGMDWRMGLVLAAARQPVVLHWIGSDLLRLQTAHRRRWRGLLYRRWVHRWILAHLADSPELADELRQYGVQARVVRLLPRLIEAEVEPLPSAFTVLSYWFDDPERRDFYGGDLVLQLAREHPAIRFNILNATGRGESAPPNVTFLGFRRDMDQVYRESSLLIRLPRHDSLSAMVLEMLARGRYVIYNKAIAGCHQATNLSEARAALQDVLARSEPNRAGARQVRQDYSLDREAEALAEFYQSL